MQRFLAVSFLVLLIGCGDKAKDLFDTALRESGEGSFGPIRESALDSHHRAFAPYRCDDVLS